MTEAWDAHQPPTGSGHVVPEARQAEKWVVDERPARCDPIELGDSLRQERKVGVKDLGEKSDF